MVINQVEQSDCLKFQGVFIDSRLTWNMHISYVSTKLRKVSFLIYKSSGVLEGNFLPITLPTYWLLL